VLATVAVGQVPHDGTIAADGAVWVPNMGDGTVFRIDPARGVVTDTVAVGAKPFVLNSAFGSVWAPSYGGRDVRRISA
jgi:YVTN family beta-propeller protein